MLAESCEATMTKLTYREAVRAGLREVLANDPHVFLMGPDVSFRDQLDIDSMDFLNFVIALDEEPDVRISESDYPKLSDLDACVEFLSSRNTAKEAS